MNASHSRKTNLIIKIRLRRYNKGGVFVDEVEASTKGYRRKKVQELEEILKKEREK